MRDRETIEKELAEVKAKHSKSRNSAEKVFLKDQMGKLTKELKALDHKVPEKEAIFQKENLTRVDHVDESKIDPFDSLKNRVSAKI